MAEEQQDLEPGLGFLYVLAYTDADEEIAALELRAMTGAVADGRLAFSPVACDIGPAAFTRVVVRVLARADDVDGLVPAVAGLGLAGERFAVDCVKVPPKPDFNGVEAEKRLADVIAGQADLTNPRRRYALVATAGGCWFGAIVSEGRRDWHNAHGQPRTFSNSLPPRLSRALVNLVAAPGDTLVDPCCGAGTVLVEAALVGARAEGYDLSWHAVGNSRANLDHFGLTVPVARADARTLEGHWDAAVIDLPYGHTSAADDDLYRDIVGNIARRVRRLAVVTGGPKDDLWREMGLTTRGLARTRATNLVRHTYLLDGLGAGTAVAGGEAPPAAPLEGMPSG
jgi:predicted RNA methylase